MVATLRPSVILSALGLAASWMVTAIQLPNIPRSLPEGTARIALDDSENKLLAYDASGNLLAQRDVGVPVTSAHKRDVSACVNLSSDDVQKLPGWSTLENKANTNWGTGKHKIVINDEALPDRPGQVCVDSSPIIIEKDGELQCTTNTQSTEGKLSDDGTVTLVYTQTTSYSSTNTVTKESSIANGMSLSATFSFEGLFNFTTQTAQGTLTNALSNASTLSVETSSASPTVTLNTPAGKRCHLEFTNESCNVQGKGKVRFVATGWVWFEYDSRVDGHYKWGLNMDDTLPNVDDRSTFAEFKSVATSTTPSEFNGICDS